MDEILKAITPLALFKMTSGELYGPEGTELLKKRYKELCLKCHPDKNKAMGADLAFHKVDTSYAQLLAEVNENVFNEAAGKGSRKGGELVVAKTDEGFFRDLLSKNPQIWQTLSPENRPALVRDDPPSGSS